MNFVRTDEITQIWHKAFNDAANKADELGPIRPMYIGIDQLALENNACKIRDRIGRRGLCAVLKGDAYGHGVDLVAPKLAEFCSSMAVVDNTEACMVREVDPFIQLIRLRIGSSSEIEQALKADWAVREMAGTVEKLREINQVAGYVGRNVEVHLSLDVANLGRNGFFIGDVAAFYKKIDEILGFPHIQISSIACHLAGAGTCEDVTNPNDPNRTTIDRFIYLAKLLTAKIVDRGCAAPDVSVYSSAASCAFGALNLIEEAGFRCFDRIGNSLFGITSENSFPEPGTRQVMHVGTKVCDVIHRHRGETIGYEHSYKVESSSGEDIALLGVGWLSLSRYQQGIGKTETPGYAINRDGGRHMFIGRQSMNISTLKAKSDDGSTAKVGDMLFLTTDQGPVDTRPTVPRVAAWMGGVQPEFVTSSFGSSSSSLRFAF